jgi:O-antigen/teichoic acid export membrane protein
LALAVREFASLGFLIQRPDLHRDDIRAAFTVTLLLTLAIVGSILLLAPLLAGAYEENGLGRYLHIAAASALMEIPSGLVLTLMRRDLCFGKVALVNVSSASVGASVTIVLAFADFSYMSFAWAWLASASVASLLAICLFGKLWMFVPLLRNWRGMVTFGSYSGLNLTLYKMYEQIPYLLFGQILTLEAAAHFQRASATSQLPDKIVLGGVFSVIFPAFSAHVRNGGHLKVPYLTGVSYLTAVQWPALVVIAILADPIVMILYGTQWLAIVPLVRIIAIAYLFSFSFSFNYHVLVSVGAIREVFLRSLIVWPVSAIILGAAAFLGLYAAALSLLIAIPFQAFVALLFVKPHLHLTWRELASALPKSAAVTIASAIGPSVVVISRGTFDISSAAAAVAVVFSAVGWLIGAWAVKHPIFTELQRALNMLSWVNGRERRLNPS